jgi:hypothetical protein
MYIKTYDALFPQNALKGIFLEDSGVRFKWDGGESFVKTTNPKAVFDEIAKTLSRILPGHPGGVLYISDIVEDTEKE